MPRAQAFIPLAKGLDQKLDERLRDADALQQVTNGYFKRGNALSKRPGFSRIPASSPTTNPKAIVSSGDELLLRGPTQLYALTEPTTAVNAYSWLAKGDVSPFTGSQRPVFSDSTSCISYDSAAADGIVLHVAASIRYTDPSTLVAGYTQELRYRIEDEATQAEIVSTQTLLTTTGTSGAGGVKAVAAGTGANARITFGYTNPALGRLQLYQQVVSTPAATPAVLITHNDLYVAALDNNFRRYDMTSLNVPNTATWSYAYVKTAVMGGPGDIFVATYNGSTLLGSWTIPPPPGTTWNWVAIADDVANNRILVAAIDATQQIRLYSQNRTSGVTTWTRLMHTTTTSTGIAVGQGSLGATVYNVVIANSASAAGGGGTSGTYNITASYTDTGGVTLSGVQTTYNAQAKSKPFFVDGRCYFTALTRYGKTSPATDNYDVEYGSEVVYDLLGGSTTSPFYPSIVARYNFGVAATRSYTASPYDEFDLGLGSFSQVQRFVGDTSKWRTSTKRVINKVGFREYVQAGDELVFDFDGVSTSATTTRGTVALGGGQVSWYSGGRVEDLGYASAPIYSATVAIGVSPGTATLDHGTYQYVAIFTAYDEKGNLIRSMPGPPISVVIPAAGGGGPNPNHYIETRWFILGPTQRWDGENYYTLTLYRAGSDGVFRRCLQPLKEPFAIRNNNYFLTVRDNGEAYDVLYTQGGAELEATGPDGAAFVAVTSKRVWLSGFFRRDRIQYSKLYTPATANEFALAPEFNDAFSYLLPGGENVTGICEMDDKIIVFTRSNIYAIAGNGPDDGGRGNDYSGLQLVASDTGCIEPRSIVSSPIGVLFRGSSGIFALGRDLQLTFIGAAVRDATDLYSEITSAVLVPSHNHVRFTCRLDGAQSIVLIYDFDQTAWLEWQIKRFTIGGGTLLNIVGACLHKGTYYVVDANGDIFRENPGTYLDDNDNVYVPMTIQTGWLQIAQQSGWQRIRKVAALCKSLDPHALRIRISQDFDSSFSQSFTWTYSEIQNMRLNELVEMHIKQQKCTAFQVTIDDFEDGSSPAVTGQGYECAGFTVELAGKRGLYKPGTQQRN